MTISKSLSAYCLTCMCVVEGKLESITELESGSYLHVGSCLICLYEIKRIVPKSKNTSYPESWMRQTPKGMDNQ